MRVTNVFAAVLARAEARDVLHRPGPEHRVQRDQVLEAVRLGVLQHAAHAGAFELEHRLGAAFGEEPVDLRVVERQGLVREVALPGMAGDDEVLGELEDRQRRQAEEVELDQADRLDVVLVELAHRAGAARLHVERAEVGDLARRDQDAAGVHADVAHQALGLLGEREQLGDLDFVPLALLDLGRFAARIDDAVVGPLGRPLQRHRPARRRRHELGDRVDVAVAHAQHPADVAQRRLRRHRPEGGDLAHRVAPVLGLHVIDDAVAVGLAEVDVEVGHRHPLGIEEALEQQLVAERIDAGDVERVGDQRAGARAAPRAHRAAVRLRPVDEVGDDQEVARKAHLQDRLDLELEARDIARALLLADRRIGIELLQSAPRGRRARRCGSTRPSACERRRRAASRSRAAAACRGPGSCCSAWRSRPSWRARSAGRRRAPPSAPGS